MINKFDRIYIEMIKSEKVISDFFTEVNKHEYIKIDPPETNILSAICKSLGVPEEDADFCHDQITDVFYNDLCDGEMVPERFLDWLKNLRDEHLDIKDRK